MSPEAQLLLLHELWRNRSTADRGSALAKAALLLAEPDRELQPAEAISTTEGRLWLVHTVNLVRNPSRPIAIDAFDLRGEPEGAPLFGLVRKRHWQPSSNSEPAALDEALFYASLQDRLCNSQFRLPGAIGLSADQRQVTLVIERLDVGEQQHGQQSLVNAATALAAFSAMSHRLDLHRTPWLKPLGQGFTIDTAGNFKRLAALCLGDQAAEGIVGDFLELFGDATILSRIEADCCPALCHGDPYFRNLLTLAGSGGTALIDFAAVRSGYIGHDAALLLVSVFVAVRPLRVIADFADAVEILHAATWTGVQAGDPAIAEAAVVAGLDLALLRTTVRYGDRFLDRLTSPPNPHERRIRQARMAGILRWGQAKARELAQHYGG